MFKLFLCSDYQYDTVNEFKGRDHILFKFANKLKQKKPV